MSPKAAKIVICCIVNAALLALVLFRICQAQAASYTLRGTLITPDETIQDGTLTVEGEKIAKMGNGPSAADIPVLNVDGVILPGMIDLHDHITWNVFPRWKPGRTFSNRYEWQETEDYARSLKNPEAKLVDAGLGCDADLFGEVKALVGGATSVVGSYAGRANHPGENVCIKGLTRSLDSYPEIACDCGRRVGYEVFPFEVAPERMDLYRRQLADGSLACLLIHLAEGSPTDASAHREFRILKAQGLLKKGVAVIHAVALKQEDFKEMAVNGVSMVWSPRSNFELYGGTARVFDAKNAGVRIALAPDWSPTGSAGMLQELHYAANWNATNHVFDDRELIKMTTSVPAGIAGLAASLGSLKPGLEADLLVVKRTDHSPLKTVLNATASDIELVVVGGTPIYGDPALMEKLVRGTKLEKLSICGTQKAVYLADTESAKGGNNQSWAEIRKQLDDALHKSGTHLGEFECR